MKKLTLSQNVKVIINGVVFYTTVRQIRNGVGDCYFTNAALQKALLVLETERGQKGAEAIAGVWESRHVQLNLISKDYAKY